MRSEGLLIFTTDFHELIFRIRRKRSERGEVDGSATSSGTEADEPRQSAEASNDRRKMLQRLRQKARGSEEEADGSSSGIATRRSKLGSRTPRSGKLRRSGTRTPGSRALLDEDQDVRCIYDCHELFDILVQFHCGAVR